MLNQDKNNGLFVVLNSKHEKLTHMIQILHMDEGVYLTFISIYFPNDYNMMNSNVKNSCIKVLLSSLK